MEGTIINYRRGRRTMRGNQMIVEVKDYTTRAKAAQLIGKKVLWTSPAKKEIHGKIVGVHGNSGAVRARFGRGMPGQAIGAKLVFVEKTEVKKKAPAKKPAAKKAPASKPTPTKVGVKSSKEKK